MKKPMWKDAIGAAKTPKRLNLKPNTVGAYECPVEQCDSNGYKSQRGCRKHVFNKHGWYFYFESRPKIEEVFPHLNTTGSKMMRSKRSSTSKMPVFNKSCALSVAFKTWLASPGGGGKSYNQADQLVLSLIHI